jgi:branched-chain amino acid transport system substrate-binding protein
MTLRRRPHGVRSLALAWLSTMALACNAAPKAAEPIVIGQSLPLSGAGFPMANRIQAGAKALVDRVNANGGISGRRLELMTLDDAGDATRHADNLGTLVRRHNAVAIVNCLGERSCAAASHATRELGVPLVGPFSGAAVLRAKAVQHVITLRPDDAKEADALAHQLRAMGLSRVALLFDDTEPARAQALAAALQGAQLQVTRVAADARGRAIEASLGEATKAAPQALVLNLGSDALEALSRLPDPARAGVPSVVATLSSASLTQVTRLFRDKLIGFTSVVPNPEVSQLAIVRELERDADAFVGPEALTFEGLASYVHLRVCVDALRRANGRFDGPQLIEAFESLGTLNLGGFRLHFGRDRRHASEHVEIGMRARDGRLRQ